MKPGHNTDVILDLELKITYQNVKTDISKNPNFFLRNRMFLMMIGKVYSEKLRQMYQNCTAGGGRFITFPE